MSRALLAGSVALSVLWASTAHASEDFCAFVLKPPANVVSDKEYDPDGWLALREAPARQSKMIAKLREGDFLLAETGHCKELDDKRVCDDKFEWTHVIGVPRVDGPDDPKKTYEDYTHGWVRRKYIQEFACQKDQAPEAPTNLHGVRPKDLPHIQIPDPPKPGRTQLTVYGPKAISEQDPPKPTPTEPPKTANDNPINLPSTMIGGWCYNKGTEARQVYIRNEGMCIGTEGVLTIWPDSYGGSGGTCTLNKIDKLAMNGYLVKSSCKGLPQGQYDGLTWTVNVELRITNGHLTVISVP